jgi:hypothetical protein
MRFQPVTSPPVLPMRFQPRHPCLHWGVDQTRVLYHCTDRKRVLLHHCDHVEGELLIFFSFSFEISRVKSLGSTNAHTNCSIQLSAIYPSISQFLYSIASSAFDLSTAQVRAQARLSERADPGFIIIANRMALYYSVISWPGLSISSLLIPNHFSIVYLICLLPLLAYTHVVQSHPHLYFGMVKTCCSI